MRITYIHQYYANLGMSGGTRSYEMARRLARRGHDVHVVTTDREATRPSWRWRRTEDDGVRVHWLPVPYDNRLSYGRRVGAFARFAVAATAKAASLDSDVVLATSTPLTVSVPGVLASTLRRRPFVFEVRDLWPEIPIELGVLDRPWTRGPATALARWTYRHADKVIALSPGMADGVAAYGYPRSDLTVVPNASDVDLFAVPDREVQEFRRSHAWLGSRPLVVYAGTLGRVNGVEHLVRVAAEVRRRDEDVRFLVVGDGHDLPRVRQAAADLGVLDRTLFCWPSLPKSDVPVVLGAASMAVSLFRPVPGLRHNSANKFFDALAAGRPVAVNYGGWQADLLEEHGAGLRMDATDPAAAAEQLLAGLGDEEWLKSASEAARTLAVREFSRDLLFDRFERVLLEAVERGRRGRRRT